MELFSLLYILMTRYVIPFVYALGLIFFIYGFIQYFIIGQAGDEGRAQVGREFLLRSCLMFFIGLVLYGVVAFFVWIGTIANDVSTSTSVSPEASGSVNRSEGLLKVPNVPGEE